MSAGIALGGNHRFEELPLIRQKLLPIGRILLMLAVLPAHGLADDRSSANVDDAQDESGHQPIVAPVRRVVVNSLAERFDVEEEVCALACLCELCNIPGVDSRGRKTGRYDPILPF